MKRLNILLLFALLTLLAFQPLLPAADELRGDGVASIKGAIDYSVAFGALTRLGSHLAFGSARGTNNIHAKQDMEFFSVEFDCTTITSGKTRNIAVGPQTLNARWFRIWSERHDGDWQVFGWRDSNGTELSSTAWNESTLKNQASTNHFRGQLFFLAKTDIDTLYVSFINSHAVKIDVSTAKTKK